MQISNGTLMIAHIMDCNHFSVPTIVLGISTGFLLFLLVFLMFLLLRVKRKGKPNPRNATKQLPPLVLYNFALLFQKDPNFVSHNHTNFICHNHTEPKGLWTE